MLDGGNGTYEPQILETWELAGCYVQQANYQEVNYNNNDPVTVQMTIRFDNDVQTPGGTGSGTNIGRALGVVATG